MVSWFVTFGSFWSLKSFNCYLVRMDNATSGTANETANETTNGTALGFAGRVFYNACPGNAKSATVHWFLSRINTVHKCMTK